MAHQSLGIDLSGWRAEAWPAETDPDGAVRCDAALRSPAPNVCVLPRVPGERPRAGMAALRSFWALGNRFPACASPWPSLGRVPAWMAWLALGQDAVNPQWSYRNLCGQDARVPLRAIIRAYAESLTVPANGHSTLKVVAMQIGRAHV